MRFLGLLFVLVLMLAAVGYYRGWYTLSTAHAAGPGNVTLQLEPDRIDGDAAAAVAGLGRLSAEAAAAVRSLGRTAGADASELEGTVSTVAEAGRDLTVDAGGTTIALHVPTGIPITRGGKTAGFGQLQPAMRVRLSFRHAGEERLLTQIEILP